MPEWEPPAQFDGFEIRCPLGRGGMGRVYLAWETALERPVALKLIAGDLPDHAARVRFSREARAIARLQHPSIVAVYRVGDVEGRPYIAYEYVDGESLDRVERPLAWTRALEIGVAVARALGRAHERGVLHRDVKPANVIVARNGGVKLVDFGLAKLLGESPASDTDEAEGWNAARVADGSTLREGGPNGALVGTPNYIAPEVWLGERASPRSDVYALGLMLYELCTGRVPYAGLSGRDLLERVTAGQLAPLASVRSELPRSFASVVDRAVSADPARRPADGGALAAELETVESVLRVFTGLAAGDAGDDASVVAASLTRIQGSLDELMTSFYDELFARRPELRALFPESLLDQKMMLGAALRLMVDNLRDPARLVPLLEDLGYRHAHYGVGASHLDLFGEALIEAISRFDRDAWNRSVAGAWRRAFAALAQAMRAGMTLSSLRVPA